MSAATSKRTIFESRPAKTSPFVLAGPATAIVVVGVLVPLLILFRYSLNEYSPKLLMVEAVTIENYAKFISDPYYFEVLLRTMRVALICTAICLLAGFPLAYVLARAESRLKNLLVISVILPLFVGNAVRAAGWMTILASNGIVNAALVRIGITASPLELMYSEGAVIAGIVAVNLPYMVLTLQATIEGIARPLEEAAFSLGANPWKMFWRVLWPLALPGTVVGMILSFILGMNAYATPVLLGGPGFQMMAPLVYGQMQLGNWPFGAAVAFVLMTTTLLLTAAGGLWMQRRYRG